MKTFIYHGVWSYEVKAESREEADGIFHATDGSEFDHNYWDVEVEEISAKFTQLLKSQVTAIPTKPPTSVLLVEIEILFSQFSKPSAH